MIISDKLLAVGGMVVFLQGCVPHANMKLPGQAENKTLEERILEGSSHALVLAKSICDKSKDREQVRDELKNVSDSFQSLISDYQQVNPEGTGELSEEISEALLDIKYAGSENVPISLRLARYVTQRDPKFAHALLDSLLSDTAPLAEKEPSSEEDDGREGSISDDTDDAPMAERTFSLQKPRLSTWITRAMADRIAMARYGSLLKKDNSKKSGNLARNYLVILSNDKFVAQCNSHRIKYNWKGWTENDCKKTVTAYLAPTTKKIYINQKRRNGATAYHEALHVYSHDDFLALAPGFVEGATEYLTRIEARRRNISRKLYEQPQAIIGSLVTVLSGRKLINEAVFSGKINELRSAVDSKLGTDTFDNLLSDMDTSACNNRQECDTAKKNLDTAIREYYKAHPVPNS